MPRAVLLTNLGSPASPDPRDLRRYLNEFLMDPHVVDLPWLARRLLVSLILLTRPKQSAEAYARIWTDGGSPLLTITKAVAEGLASRLDMPVAWAMRYGEPAIGQVLDRLLTGTDIDELLLMPMYPHYAMSTTLTTARAVAAALRDQHPHVTLKVRPPFYAEPRFIALLAASLRRHAGRADHVLFSYHGLPERHLVKTDPSGDHCLRSEHCCEMPHHAHATCYRHQVLTTTREVAAAAGLAPGTFSSSFQSRLGRQPWLTPYTDHELERLAHEGVRHLAVVCPAFTADNLETLEEIGMRGRSTFEASGGKCLTLVPCLNDEPEWLDLLADWSRDDWPKYAA